MWYSLHSFYTSREWNDLLLTLKASRVDSNGDIICEYCGKPIYKMYDCIGHHKKELTLENVNDTEGVSLNPNNIMLVHHKCHNDIHARFGGGTRHIYLLCGGEREDRIKYVEDNAAVGDLICEVPRIRECVQFGLNSNRCDDNVFAIRSLLYDMIKYKRGKWCNAWLIGEYKYIGERERISNELGAEVIDVTK